jgi:hypothetical protein
MIIHKLGHGLSIGVSQLRLAQRVNQDTCDLLWSPQSW